MKRLLNLKISFDTDQTRWNTVWDISDDLNFYLSQKGLTSHVYSDGEEKHPEILLAITSNGQQVVSKPATDTQKQLENVHQSVSQPPQRLETTKVRNSPSNASADEIDALLAEYQKKIPAKTTASDSTVRNLGAKIKQLEEKLEDLED